MVELVKALYTFGVKGSVRIKCIDRIRFSVYIDGEYFGIWDDTRKTFVD